MTAAAARRSFPAGPGVSCRGKAGGLRYAVGAELS
ncbi:protein of unknown function [Streptomyces sp. KY75]|nr:protein of unknown function [Streptomyces sp. KY75]